jgi:hypothetical protein
LSILRLFGLNCSEYTLKLSLKAEANAPDDALNISPWNGLLRTAKSPGGELGNWTLTGWLEPGGDADEERIHPNVIEDILVVCHLVSRPDHIEPNDFQYMIAN